MKNKMTFDKGGNIFKYEKKDGFSHETILVFLHGDVFKNGSRNSVTFKMEVFAEVSNGRAYKQLTVVFASCCVKSTIFMHKIKIG